MFQWLLRTALAAFERGVELEERNRELASLQVGLISTMLKTLSLRDNMTARHSAAVARYSRADGRAELGLSEREQELIHTAGLFHDIGKFIFPDSILLADTRPDRRASTRSSVAIRRSAPSSWRRSTATARWPRSSATITSASTVAATPTGLAGEDIPLGAR